MSYSREEVKAITDKVLNMAKADAVEVAFCRRRAIGDAVRELDDHRQPGRARSAGDDHRLLRPESGVDLDAPVRRCVAEVGDRAGAGAGEAAAGQPGADAAGEAAAGLPGGRRGAAAGGRTSGPAERARLVKQSVDVCEKKGVLGARLHPEAALDRRARELRGAVRLQPLRRGELHPHLPHAGRHRIGLGGDDGPEGRVEDRRGRASPKSPPTRR